MNVMAYESKETLRLAAAYRDYTAENLGKLIRVPGFSCTEQDRI